MEVVDLRRVFDVRDELIFASTATVFGRGCNVTVSRVFV
jgi:hypothetical protein